VLSNSQAKIALILVLTGGTIAKRSLFHVNYEIATLASGKICRWLIRNDFDHHA
jgi:hypothetical protein